LVWVLHRLVDARHTVLAIEHDLSLIAETGGDLPTATALRGWLDRGNRRVGMVPSG